MWNLISYKSEFKEFKRSEDNKKLVDSISKAKSRTDTSCPKSLMFNFRRPFGKSKQDRQKKKEILHENQLLLGKMLKIDLKTDKSEIKLKELSDSKSLNKLIREERQNMILKSNKVILKRVKSVEPVYSSEEWKTFNRFQNYVRDNISRNSGRVTKMKVKDLNNKPEEVPDDFIDKLYELNKLNKFI